MTDKVTLTISLKDLKDLVKSIDADFGFDYNIDGGLAALEKLKELLESAETQ